jgi:plastocyanin
MRTLLPALFAAAPLLAVAACGSSYNSSAPTGPTSAPTSTPPAGAVVIDIVGINGARSFSPNPSTASSGQMVVWHNVDGNVHHIVLDDSRLDTGIVSPQSFTTAMVLATPGRYHCTIHPEMVGTISGGQ